MAPKCGPKFRHERSEVPVSVITIPDADGAATNVFETVSGSIRKWLPRG